MPVPTPEQIRDLSAHKPNWIPGSKLRLKYPKPSGSLLHDIEKIYTLKESTYRRNIWYVTTEETGNLEYYSARFALDSNASQLYKTNHKIGAPKGKLP